MPKTVRRKKIGPDNI